MAARATRVGHADLLRLLAGADPGDRAALAALAGFAARPSSQAPAGERMAVPEQPFAAGHAPPAPAVDTAPEEAPQAPAWFWCPVSRERVVDADADQEAPRWLQEVRPVGEVAREHPAPCAPTELSLLHWPRLLGFLRHHCVTSRPSRLLDEPRLVRGLAGGRRLRRIPYRQHAAWPGRLVLLLDRHEALYPLRKDFRRLAERLQRLLGTRLWIVGVDECTDRERPLPDLLDAAGLGPEAAADARWLVLSDLGTAEAAREEAREQAGQGARGRFWRRLLGEIRDLCAGRPPLALVPMPADHWWPGIPELALAAPWDLDRPLRLARSAGEAPAAPDCAPLLALLSMVVEARPRLLRKLRRLLPPVQGHVGCELGVWNHPRVLRWLPVCQVVGRATPFVARQAGCCERGVVPGRAIRRARCGRARPTRDGAIGRRSGNAVCCPTCGLLRARRSPGRVTRRARCGRARPTRDGPIGRRSGNPVCCPTCGLRWERCGGA